MAHNPYSASATHANDLQRLENETLRAQVAAMQFKLNNSSSSAGAGAFSSSVGSSDYNSPFFDSAAPGPNSRLAKQPLFNHQLPAAANSSSASAAAAAASTSSAHRPSSYGYQAAAPVNYGGHASNYSSSYHLHQAAASPSTAAAPAPQLNAPGTSFDTLQAQERCARLVVFLGEATERCDLLRRFGAGAVDNAAYEADRRSALIRKVQNSRGSEAENERLRQSVARMETELHEAADFVNQLHSQLQRSTQERSELSGGNTKLTTRLTEALALRSSEEKLRIYDDEKARSEIAELKSRLVELKEDNERLRRHERQMIEELGDATHKIGEYSAALDLQRNNACSQECKDAKEHRDMLVRDAAKMKDHVQQLEIKLRRANEETVPLLVHKQEVAVLKSEIESRDRLLAAIQQRSANSAAAEDLSSRLQMQLEQERAVIVQLQTQIQEERANHAADTVDWRAREARWQVHMSQLEADLESTHARLEGSRQDYARATAALQACTPAQTDLEREQVAAKLLVAAREIERLTEENMALQDYVAQHQQSQYTRHRR